ncbi:carboxypeptidase M32 [Vallitalea sp.]|jgi:carboxypeptidase Taq|uniref:carboxypeptidase M32 n=1 Tax=Vallitalea sp. TaxID=1882829 RepID=UPI0025E2D5D3|nr:carboxypeptidase M32 [Vallitalea sp.]MCT4688369.1 carboxypeptidase M32 [Vallitalea sp.]
MDIKTAISKLNEADDKLHAIEHALALIQWDAATGAPKNSVEGRAKTLSILTGEYYKTLVNDELNELLSLLEDNKNELEYLTLRKAEEFRNEYDKIAKIPVEIVTEYTEVRAKASAAWEDAKIKSDFSIFAPHLEKVIEFSKKFIEYRGYTKHPYNTLLDDYEKGLTTDDLDKFFSELKNSIVPLVAKIKESKVTINDDFIKKTYPTKEQEALNKKLLKSLGFNMDSGMMAESQHPFTTNFNKNDVRITTHYFENNLLPALYSTLHEGGHAIYEQNIGEELNFTSLGTGTSMGIHESQSRFFENIVGRSHSYIEYLYPIIKEAFPEHFKDVTCEDLYEAANKSELSLVRTDADELTYSLHIMIRYEIEKLLFENKILVSDLPEIWNKKYKEYMGLTPQNDADGILQDVHWSEGLFGYFPSYALGNAYASQFANKMKETIDFEKDLKQGNLENIREWLKENIHKYGKLLTPSEIIENATGEPLNAKYYIDYLEDKYSKIYDL